MKRGSKYYDIHLSRARFEKAVGRFKSYFPGLTYQPLIIENIKCEWIIPDKHSENSVILFFHGGGYAAGSIITHRAMVSRICLQTGMNALLFEYRLAPENTYPAPIEDSVKMYQWLLKQGYMPEQIAFVGDSAGGGLAIGTALYLRDNHQALPKCIVSMSPWLDFSLTGESYHFNKVIDPVLTHEGFPLWSKAYMGDADPKSPYASPIYHKLNGLPPIYIQVGEDEMLLSDSIRFAEKAKMEGAPVQMEIFPGMFHVFHGYWRVLPEARQAIKKLADFLKTQMQA